MIPSPIAIDGDRGHLEILPLSRHFRDVPLLQTRDWIPAYFLERISTGGMADIRIASSSFYTRAQRAPQMNSWPAGGVRALSLRPFIVCPISLCSHLKMKAPL